jgi:hypothetical protein
MRRRAGGLAVVALLAIIGSACLPISTPGDTSGIQLVSTTTQNGWKYDFYRDVRYACAVSGFQTFVVGTKVGSNPGASAPLWTMMHGGGAGYFNAAGQPVPGPGQKVEEGAASLMTRLTNNGILARVRADAAGFRTLAVSMCSHDVYGGVLNTDPNNPNTTPNGNARLTTGMISVKAAIQYTKALYPTTKTFLHGGSAGSAGAYYVGWSMQLQGIAPAGVIGDASLINQEGMAAGYAAGICTDTDSPERAAAIGARVHPDVANRDNEVDKLVSTGRLTVPLLHIWNHGDKNTCGAPPMACPMRDGTTVTMGYTDCLHEPLKRAIAAQGPSTRSMNLPLCVDDDAIPDCSVHVVTNKAGLVNTDPSSPADFSTTIMSWVHARLADA